MCAPFSGVILTRPRTFPLVRERKSDVSDSGSVEMSPYARSKDDSKQLNIKTMHEGGTLSWRDGESSSGRPIGRCPSLRSKCTSCFAGPHFLISASRAFSSSGLRALREDESVVGSEGWSEGEGGGKGEAKRRCVRPLPLTWATLAAGDAGAGGGRGRPLGEQRAGQGSN